MPTPTPPQKSDLPAPIPPTPPVAVQVGQATPAEALAVQYQQLTQQLLGLREQRRVLQIQVGSGEPQVAATARAQLSRVETDIARVSVDLAGVRGQMGGRIGQPGARPPFDFPQNNGRRQGGMDSSDVTGIAITFILAVLMPISIGITRRLLRRTPKDTGAALTDVISPRLDRLEQAVDAIAIEVERIAEGQRFVTKVMSERPVAVPARTTPAPAEAAPGALGDAKPFLALGAGPIEPIRAAERQAVRQSITPH